MMFFTSRYASFVRAANQRKTDSVERLFRFLKHSMCRFHTADMQTTVRENLHRDQHAGFAGQVNLPCSAIFARE